MNFISCKAIKKKYHILRIWLPERTVQVYIMYISNFKLADIVIQIPTIYINQIKILNLPLKFITVLVILVYVTR